MTHRRRVTSVPNKRQKLTMVIVVVLVIVGITGGLYFFAHRLIDRRQSPAVDSGDAAADPLQPMHD